MADAAVSKPIIGPLDPSRHDRAAFSCGVIQVDNFFKKTASKLSKADNLRVYVMTESDGKTVIGFYAINTHSISYADLPERFARNRPGYGAIPAAYISMIGRDQRYRGGGYGGDLLADCLKKLAGIAEQVGIAVVLLDILDCGDEEKTNRRAARYAGYGFQPLPSMPLRMFLPTATIRSLIG
ncbi:MULTISPECIES: GNAT family N-acetyltransferase [Sinorhizobium]|uniref:GNAT family N-acetyltransferase n=2 Tax=Sinorhizobium TaxID=28105 RepID=A0A6N7LLN6_SINTE|nr:MULTISPECIES: GNAT family N-acetyltransferase [Sinorhizobium]MBB4188408.1 GNAT superfamily N-acetyltransferase [Sinorhizobium terangae]MCZ4093340.1 GNAT family N-acetyltransferase [Sinorhizobium psoraleae]MQX18118.1 GNAT family N-acetyltransferase [Sinorhizobium terangae]